MKIKTILLLFLFLNFYFSCTIKERFGPELPLPTNTGAGIMACKVNGQIWYTDGSTLFDGANVQADLVSNTLKLKGIKYNYDQSGYNNTSSWDRIYIVVNSVNNTGTFQIAGNNHGTYEKSGNTNNYVIYKTDSTYSGGYINITTFDSMKKILSGNFQFKAKNSNGNDEVLITEGQFDIKY